MIHSKRNIKGNILVIEHNPIVSLYLLKQLENGGYYTQCVTTPSMVSNMEANKPELIVTDTPTDSAYFQTLKKNWPGSIFPVICTSNDRTERNAKEKDLKIIGTFLRPFDSIEILNTINRYFEIK